MKRILLLCVPLLMAQCDEFDNPTPPKTPYDTGLNIVSITTPSPVTSKETWVEGASMEFISPTGEVFDVHGISIRGRGNATWLHPKKPYAIKLEKKAKILGMPKHKRWVLLQNYLDRTLMRNWLGFEVAKQTSLAWTPSGVFVELVMNGKHQGNYFLVEQIKVDKNRVNIDEDTGYLMEIDTYFDETFKFRSKIFNLPYMFKNPDDEVITGEQIEYMEGFINSLEASLNDDAKLLAQDYLKYIDIDSFIDYWIVQEMMLNLECNHPKSVYCYKERDGKLHMGPVWDFDCKTLCNVFFQDSWDEDRSKHRADQFCIRHALYYGRLFKDPYFREKVQERWEAVRYDIFDVIKDYQTMTNDLVRSDVLNHAMWPLLPYQGDEEMTFRGASKQMESIFFRKYNFMQKRISTGDFSQP